MVNRSPRRQEQQARQRAVKVNRQTRSVLTPGQRDLPDMAPDRLAGFFHSFAAGKALDQGGDPLLLAGHAVLPLGQTAWSRRARDTLAI